MAHALAERPGIRAVADHPVVRTGARVAADAAGAAGALAAPLTPIVDPLTPVTVPPRVRARRAGLPTVVVGAALAGFTALFWLVRTRRTDAFDLAWTLRLQRRRRPWLDAVMTTASWPGFPPQSRLIPSSLIAALWLGGLRREAAFLAIAWGSALVSTAVKTLMNRPRPIAGTDLRVVAAPLGGSSFPSGHVLTFVGTYGFATYLAAVLFRDPAIRAGAVGAGIVLIALVGPSRIYQGHHWPTDVSASYLVGSAWLLAVVAGYRRAALPPIDSSPDRGAAAVR
jgi:undecaprenyl-diphosphatase